MGCETTSSVENKELCWSTMTFITKYWKVVILMLFGRVR